jgi:quinol monooxygenase YgiN
MAVAVVLFTALASAQTPEVVYVATYFEVQPASVEAGATLITRYVRETSRAPGNLRADAFREIGRGNRFVVIEAWSEQASFDDHESAAPTQAFREDIGKIRRAPLDQRVNSGFAIDTWPQTTERDSVFVVTHVDVPPPSREAAEGLLLRLVEASRADAGNTGYDIYQQYAPRTNHFTVFAGWRNRAAFDADGNSSHWGAFRDSLAPMLGALYDERLYQRLAP